MSGSIWEHTTSLGYGYCEMEDYDIQEICHKCHMAYNKDFLPQDCDICILPRLVETVKSYAERLEVWEEEFGEFY